MKIQSLVCTVMLALLVFAGDALAIGPGSGQGGAGGGGGDDVGVPPDYGDLVILYRNTDGIPILTPETLVDDPETGLPVIGGSCWQPIAFNFSVPEDPEDLCPATCVVTSDPLGAEVVAVDQYNCAIEVGCSGCTQEVDFGRINEARAPDTVLASQLDDVLVNLATADCVTLDPAGRLVTSRVETVETDGVEEDVVLSAAIDSPLQNLAIYKQLMLEGLGGDLGTYLPQGASVLDTAARALGAASGKSGEVNVDLVAYLNQIMGLSDLEETSLGAPICQDIRKEVMGKVGLVEECFLNYGETGPNYSYGRGTNFGALPAPAYIPDAFGTIQEGWFEVLGEADASTESHPLFEINRTSTFVRVFGGANNTDKVASIGGFAQAADDARAVINFMHSWPLPEIYATGLTCEASNDIGYDLSISPESGLQVPVQMVATTEITEGREFIITVANAGPDPANGTVLVTVTTTEGDDTAVVEIVGTDGPYWAEGVNRFEFPFADLAAGTSESWTVMFTMRELIATKLSWTATIDAEDDVLPSNNTVTATTNVRLTGKGGGRP